MENKDKRFIEDTFPIREVSVEGAKEKNIRHGHISTLHIWWARRPLATSRATIFAALIQVVESEEEKQKIRNFIAELSKWENTNNEALINRARKLILNANGDVPPKVLDPFGGGGSIPLEALRLGCETYSNDYNPVAVLIQKCTIEYPQKYGKFIPYYQYKKERPWLNEKNDAINDKEDAPKENLFLNDPQSGYQQVELVNPLLEDVKYWGKWLLEEVKKKISQFYPVDLDGATTVGYIWGRTIPCQNPTCGVEIPLLRQYYLSKKAKKQVVIYPYIKEGKIEFKIIGGDYSQIDASFNPENGTISRAVVSCPLCGSVTDENIVPKLFQNGKDSQRMIVIVTHNEKVIELRKDINEVIKKLNDDDVPFEIVKALQDHGFKVEKKHFTVSGKKGNSFLLIYNSDDRYIEFKVTLRSGKITIEPQGKAYRIASQTDINVYKETEKQLVIKREELMNLWGIDPKPDEDFPPIGTLGFRIQRYGLLKWGDLFNDRETLALIIFCEALRSFYSQTNFDIEYSKAISCYLALGIDRVANRCSVQNVWNISAEKAEQVFIRQTMQMLWDYCEVNAVGNQGWDIQFYYIGEALKKLLKHPFYLNSKPVTISNLSATKLSYPDNYFDAIITDPPYYDNVPYSHLSDFFFIWLKRSLVPIFPEYFSTPLTPKKAEIVAYSHNEGGAEAGKIFFEDNLRIALKEISRMLKPNGITIIVYAHKSTSGWETVINALLDSSLVISGSYPLNTEMEGRMRATDSASLSSSIYIIARKIERKETGFYNEVKDELKKYLNSKLDQLWAEGIVGADFFIAAIGSAIEVFGKYEKVIDYEGNIKRADVLLDDVREIVMNYTVAHILHNGFSGEVSELTRFYVIFRFSYGEAKLEFDEANKLARSVGIDLTQEFNKNGFIKKEREFVRVLAANNRKIDELQDKFELIDVLHHSLLLWESDKKDKMMQLLAETGFGKSEAFFRVAQAISESLAKSSPESKEKKWIDQFVSTKDRIKANITTTKVKPKKEQQGKIQFE